MKTALFFALIFVGSASASIAQTTAPPAAPVLTADQIYFKAVAQLRNLPEPPYIEYTLSMGGSVLHHGGSSVNRVVYRTADGTTFSHVISENGKPVESGKEPDAISEGGGFGPDFMMVMQRNAGKKPGQNSIFGLSMDALATPDPVGSTDGLKTVGAVRAIYNSHYAVTLSGAENYPGCGASAYHLALRARRDPMNNPVREMWVDSQTFNVCRVSLGVMLNEGPFHAPVAADVTFARYAEYWLVREVKVAGRSRFLFMSASMAFGSVFSEVSFPRSEPAWMFDRKLYALHAGREAKTGMSISIH